MHRLRVFLQKIIISIQNVNFWNIFDRRNTRSWYLLSIFDTQFMYYNSNKRVIKLAHILCHKQHKIMLKVPTHISFHLFIICVPDDICSLDCR